VSWADKFLPSPEICQVYVNAGNDDPLFVDEILDRSAKIIRPEGQVLSLPCNLKLVSTGYSNITPWGCPRDVKEPVLEAKIAQMTANLAAADLRKAIFNFHCPPKNTSLDWAFKINPATLRPYAGFRGAQREHVGSTAVRKAIEHWQPLIGLHGHIHESCAKDHVAGTVCFNPGSDYRTGHLQGVFIQINRSGSIEADILTQERDSRIDRVKPRSWIETALSLVPGLGHLLETHQASSQREEIKEAVRDVHELLVSIERQLAHPPIHVEDTPSGMSSTSQKQ
jgi:Icc-related predicted phosphoesterase